MQQVHHSLRLLEQFVDQIRGVVQRNSGVVLDNDAAAPDDQCIWTYALYAETYASCGTAVQMHKPSTVTTKTWKEILAAGRQVICLETGPYVVTHS